ncbi:helix-turn-helix domain-containing protein [Faecalibacillus faecis]
MNKNFFEELLNKKKITRYKLCKITGISSGGLTDLLNKNAFFKNFVAF